jgi:hypothetical protein
MNRTNASENAPEESSLRWQQMGQTMCIDDAFSVGRACEREAWRGTHDAATEILKQAMESVGVSSKAIATL